MYMYDLHCTVLQFRKLAKILSQEIKKLFSYCPFLLKAEEEFNIEKGRLVQLATESQNHGVLRKKRKTSRATEENVSHKRYPNAKHTCVFSV